MDSKKFNYLAAIVKFTAFFNPYLELGILITYLGQEWRQICSSI